MADLVLTRDPPPAAPTLVRDPPPASTAAPVQLTRDPPPAPTSLMDRVTSVVNEIDPAKAFFDPNINFFTAPIRGLAGDAYGAFAGDRAHPGDILPTQEGFYKARGRVVDATQLPENTAGGIVSKVLGIPGELITKGAKAASDATLGQDWTRRLGPAATVAADVAGSGLLKMAPRIAGAAALGSVAARDFLRTGDLPRAVRMAVSPMTEGSDAARGIAKDFANSERHATFMRGHFDDQLKRYDPAQRAAIWNAADQASVAAQRAHADAMARGAKGDPVSFKTAKGSKYTVQPDGTTIRDKAARPEHPGQQGIQPKSHATYYVPDKDVNKLSLMQAQNMPARALVHDNGHIGIQALEGPNKGKIYRDTVVRVSDKPAVGLTPIETWNNGQRVHFGNPITEVESGGEAAARLAAQQAGEAALAHLPPDVRFNLDHIQKYSEDVWKQAQDVGMVEGAPLPFYMTRALVNIGEDGAASYVKPVEGKGGTAGPQGAGGLPLDAMGVNLRTTGTQARAHLTAEETEAAGRARFGPNAMILRDVRTLPLAVERMEKAVAGRKLINDIKAVSQAAGNEAVSDVEKPGFFTVDHPAFKTYKPRMTTGPDGKVVPVKDAEGNIVFDRTPIYVSREFEGPLRAVLRHKGSPIYSALMDLKGKSMSVIMNSPLIHNMVEWGRALPMMPGKVATGAIYFEGNRFRRDVNSMSDAVRNGLVPIGHRGYVQDITGLAEEPNLKPGRSTTAAILGKAGDLYSKETGDAIRRGIDKAGDFWHNTLLWDRVADLQAGIYKNARDTFIKKGLDPQTAGRVAAHLANRYAGALPHEAMSEMARKVGNFVLFSRSFTLGNIGALKDVMTGLPMDVQAQIARDAGTLTRDKAVGSARRKATNAFLVDLALYYAGNSITQNAFDVLSRDQSLSDVEKGYVDRMKALLARTQEHPLDSLNLMGDVESLTPNADNEPGKENRILMGYDKDGTALYMRLPVGKIGEEFQGWATEPLAQFTRKEGTIMRPLLETLTNDKGFGRHVYDPDAKGLTANMQAAGNILWNFFQSGIPTLQLDAAGRVIRGEERPADVGKTLAPFFGFNVSKGYPGGPAMGVVAAENRRKDEAVRNALPDINDAIRAGRVSEGIQKLQALGVPPGLIKYFVKVAQNPALRMSQRKLLDFYRSATPDEIARFEKAQQGAPH